MGFHWDEEKQTYMPVNLGDILYRGDIGMARERKKAIKKEDRIEGDPDLQKELIAVKKQLDKQAEIIKDLLPHITSLGDTLADAAIRMEQDTIDDVYSIGHMREEFRKLSVKLKKLIPEPKITGEMPF